MVAIGLAAFEDATDAGWSVPVGCPVLDVWGEKVGTVAGADAEALIVAHAFFWEYRVPFAAVAEYDGEALRLKVTKAAAKRGEWETEERGDGAPVAR